MHELTPEELAAARDPIASLLSKSEKAAAKVSQGTWQHARLADTIRALRIALPLVDGDAGEASAEELAAALPVLDGLIERVEGTKTRFEPGTSQHSLQRNRLAALRVAGRSWRGSWAGRGVHS